MVGVPEIVPPLDIVRPGGRPVAVNVYGPPTPPPPIIVTGVIGFPATAVIVTQFAVGGLGAITIEQLLVMVLLAWFPDESTACAVKLNVPGVVGVPVIAPVEGLSVRPVGKDPEIIE